MLVKQGLFKTKPLTVHVQNFAEKIELKKVYS